MLHTRWERVKAILAEAVEARSAGESRQIVDRACAGDPEMRREIEALLANAAGIFDLFDLIDDLRRHRDQLWKATAAASAADGAAEKK